MVSNLMLEEKGYSVIEMIEGISGCSNEEANR
jgi:hypothetical protein